ncbi:amidase [Paenalcaligenes hermetiae]|uniref:Amidase n=1 Tax=Paenalcaligenes hermetiae TaxID=1157987 RepID=A0ABP9LXB5_9BURK
MTISRREFIKKSSYLASAALLTPSLILPRSILANTTWSPSEQQILQNEITLWDALTLSKNIKNKKVSCVEVMQAYLNKIHLLNPKVNALVSLQDPEVLIQQAREKDQQLSQGNYLGWMHGFPHAIKDLSATQGITTTFGSPLFKSFIPKEDGIMVSRIRQAGAIFIGKSNTPEFGYGSQTYNTLFGTTLNAYDPSKTAGGSSGGAAVALALKMLPVADGSDMMGSLRNPAAFNNVIGYRPSQGIVPVGPTKELYITQLGYEGPMGRTISDTARLLATQAGPDPRAPLSAHIDLTPLLQPLTPPKSLRIGWLGNLNGSLPIDPDILHLCEQGLNTLAAMGHHVEPTQFPLSEIEIWKAWLGWRHWMTAGLLEEAYLDPNKKSQLKPEIIWELEGGLKMNAVDTFRAAEARSRVYQAFLTLYQNFDILVLPTAQVFPFDADIYWPKTILNKEMDTYHRWMEVVTPASLAGLPTLNVPVGFNQNRLPMGMQLMGRLYDDITVLQLGYAYEQETRWNIDHMPPLIQG